MSFMESDQELSYANAKVSEVRGNTLELLNSLDSEESEVEITVLPPEASALTEDNEGNENEVNTDDIIIKDVPGSLEEPSEKIIQITSVLSEESMRKKERVMSDFEFDKNCETFLVRWNDNSTVPVATNFSTLQPFVDMKSRIRGHEDTINDEMQNLINSYY
ncbi:hypothetical protein TNCT_683211 [Trichonephila clavata]|uniref:Uncharacterized protein n=1 Tax=Trichonephila clavata TaxID=2740835 RepID=A0A8X6HTF1_TRICU|nr:hypothetical protein TNCT_683211 [Trichonephila clavata]